MGWVGSEFFLADTQSRLYPHMRAKFGRDPTVVSKKVSFKFIIGLFGSRPNAMNTALNGLSTKRSCLFFLVLPRFNLGTSKIVKPSFKPLGAKLVNSTPGYLF